MPLPATSSMTVSIVNPNKNSTSFNNIDDKGMINLGKLVRLMVFGSLVKTSKISINESLKNNQGSIPLYIKMK